MVLALARQPTRGFSGKRLLNAYAALVEPFDMVFIVDRSGSMLGSRWDALKTAVDGFTPTISTVAPLNSNFGFTLFASNVLSNNSFSSSLTTVGASLSGDVSAELNSQTPLGSTAMGKGLQNGMAKMTVASRPRVVVLFTDGEQNQNPNVDMSGCTYFDAIANSTSLINPDCPSQPGASIRGQSELLLSGSANRAEITLQHLRILLRESRHVDYHL